jgi:hypothetical protein
MQMVRNEDQIQPLSQEKLTRVQRALDGRNVGLTLENLTITSVAASSAVSATASKRRTGAIFSSSSNLNKIGKLSELEEEHQIIVAQNDYRHAQDKLLLLQLDRGVLPERFIKQGVDSEDPLHVSVILSKFGIGDVRGICLGNW